MTENMRLAINYRNTIREQMRAGMMTYEIYERKLEIMCDRLSVDLREVILAA